MLLADRAAGYASAFPDYPPLVTHGDWLYGVWMIGACYKATNPLYGSYPPSYLKRVHSLFPDATNVLHLFSGGLAYGETAGIARDHGPSSSGRYARLELVDSKGPDEGRYPTYQGDVTQLPCSWEDRFDLVLCDPPYSKEDAEKYGVKLAPSRKVMAEAARVTRPGGNLVWLDTTFPMFRKVDWRLWGTVGLIRSTNHRTRMIFMFERQA